MNIYKELRKWENEEQELNQIAFADTKEMAAFIAYAYRSLDDETFEILMDKLSDL